jgi:hypothetical protein
MSSLPTWAAWAIVAACPLLGPVIAFLVFSAVVVLDRWVTGAREAPAIVSVAAGVIGGYLRRQPFRRSPRLAPGLAHSDPTVAAALSPVVFLFVADIVGRVRQRRARVRPKGEREGLSGGQ